MRTSTVQTASLWAFAFSTVLLTAQNFPPIETDQEIRASMNFLTSLDTTVGVMYTGSAGQLSGKLLPLSYFSTVDYWGKYVGTLPGNDLTVIDVYNSGDYTLTPSTDSTSSPGSNLQIERVNVYNGTDIYDAACWQIALGVYGKAQGGSSYFSTAENQNLLLTVGYDGNADQATANANRATTQGNGTFSYNGQKITNAPNAYFFRMITRNWLSTDPFMGTPYMSHISTQGSLPPNYQAGQITWLDWKPITGENAWGFLLGPLQLSRLEQQSQTAKYVPFSSTSVQNALAVLNAFAMMQSPIGGIYYALSGTYGNQGTQPVDPYEVSVENNASTLGGLLTLKKILSDEAQYESDLNQSQKDQIQSALNTINTMINGGATPQGYHTEGLLSFFKTYAWDAANGIFLQGGLANKPNNNAWVPTSEPKAVDVNTWGLSVLGQPIVDEWLGFGTAYTIWQNVKSWGGYYGPDGSLWGVGYSDQDHNGKGMNYQNGIISAEWTAGAVNMARCLITQYTEASQSSHYTDAQKAQAKQYVAALQQDHDSMFKNLMTLRNDEYVSTAAYDSVRPQDYASLIPVPSDKLAFLYASKRYMIPFGWYANPLPSTTSTAWTIMLHYNFNPFHPDGTYETSFPIAETPLANMHSFGPTAEDYSRFADILVATLQNVFSPQDFVFLTKRAEVLLNENFNLTLEEKRAGVVAILNEIIEKTDTPLLPDFIFDPIFEAMTPTIVHLLVQDPIPLSDGSPIHGKPASNASYALAKTIADAWGKTLFLINLPDYWDAIVDESMRYKDLSREEKLAFAQSSYSYFLQITDTEEYPDFLVDPFIKQLGYWVLAELINF